MDAGHIVVRCVFTYVASLILLRVSGKRTVAEATTFDFVLMLILGDIFDDVFFSEVPASQFIVALTVLVFMQAATATCCYYSTTMYSLLQGDATVLMRNGKAQQGPMKAELVNVETLDSMLRQSSIAREKWEDVKLGLLERGGEFSIIKEKYAEEMTKGDLQKSKENRQ